jgi:hypothetical protein
MATADRPGISRYGIHALQIIHETDLAESAIVIAGGTAGGDPGFQFITRDQGIDQLLRQRELGQVAVRGVKQGRIVVDLRFQRRGVELARLGDIGEMARPDIVHPVQVGFIGFRRGIGPDVGLAGRLVFTDAKQVGLDAQLVEGILEIGTVTTETFQQHRALRVQQHFIGLGREQVAALFVAVGVGIEFLAGLAERAQRRGKFARAGRADAGDAVRDQQDLADMRILCGGFERAG